MTPGNRNKEITESYEFRFFFIGLQWIACLFESNFWPVDLSTNLVLFCYVLSLGTILKKEIHTAIVGLLKT